MPKLIDMTGERYGRLMVVKLLRYEKRKPGAGGSTPIWECRCDCGNVIEASRSNLRRSCTRSCGCWNVDAARIMSKKMKKAWAEVARAVK